MIRTIPAVLSSREILPSGRRILPSRLALTLPLLLCLTVSAWADFVSGRVFDPNQKPVPNMAFTADDGKGHQVTFKTDNSGNFSVYLDPGTYQVHPSADQTLAGQVRGYPQSTQEDIHLEKKK